MSSELESVSRRKFLTNLVCISLVAATPLASQASAQITFKADELTADDLKTFEKVAGLNFSDAERTQILGDVKLALKNYASLRSAPITYQTEPHTIFTPLGGGTDPKSKIVAKPTAGKPIDAKKATETDIAFLSTLELSRLIKSKQISSVELTQLYLKRLRDYGDKLLCVVTLTPDLALEQARVADKELASGHYRGPLHGIPYGIKDLFATKDILTTWGAAPYKSQVFTEDATVVTRLHEAGAVLCAKLSLGALAMGDVWFRGTTKNPWDLKRGSSGSSAGSACSTAAGLVGFSIGTETWGSITSPSLECRTTGLRPSYGRVSRYGAMALSYTMDKVGPICRKVEDCALVLAAIAGHDPHDPSSIQQPFNWRPKMDVKKLKIGILDTKEVPADSMPINKTLHDLGFDVKRVKMTPAEDILEIILAAESASAFDAFTRSNDIHDLKNSAWPAYFRYARHIPAVEYLQAHRMRALLMERFEQEFGDRDIIIGADITESILLATNLTGHPQVIIPNGTDSKGLSKSLSFIGRLYREDSLLLIAELVQDMSDFHRRRPNL